MSSKTVTLVALLATIFSNPRVEAMGLVEMISDYARVVKHTEKPTTENVSVTELPPDNTTEAAVEYEDFDEIPEEDRSLKQGPSSDTMLKYFNGVVSLLALMNKFSGRPATPKPQKNANEPREEILKETGKRYQEAQDRFEFPQKKFRYQPGADSNMIDQQFQPVENYPPYNPLSANSAETYNKDDKKTSYDADLTDYDRSKNSISSYGHDNVEIQQSYSYEIPYETPKPAKPTPHHDDWTSQIQPVYQPWMTKPKDETIKEDSYQSWHTKPQEEPVQDDSYQPWGSKPSYQPWKDATQKENPKPTNGDSEPRQPWKDKLVGNDYPIYHHDFKGPPDDHHFEYQEVEHGMDEDRVNKKPYSYYFLGRKLWYVPLLFSVYFIIYVGALVLKSVARHKIQFPEKIWDLHDEHFGHGKHRRHRKVDDITENYENAIENISKKFM